MQFVKAFIAGFLATLIFHQGVLALFHTAGMVPMPAWNMSAMPPLNIPSVISLAFWGGLWGIALWLLIRGMTGARYWLIATIVGSVAATAVAMLVVFRIKGLDVDANIVVGGLILNAAWGFGVALFMRLMRGIA